MTTDRRLYLDHAATSWPKSAAVLASMNDYAVEFGATAGRGAYGSAMVGGEVIRSARRAAAKLIGSADPSNISFHSSGTTALNAAILGVLRPGDHVVTTRAEHNSVLRPIEALRRRGTITVTIVPCDVSGVVDPTDVIAAIQPATRLVAVTSASNVTGGVQRIDEIADRLGLIKKTQQVAFLVDAAQSIGWVNIDVNAGIDLLAAPAHKAIGAPLGTALLHVDRSWHDEVQSTLFGGTGTSSDTLDMPTTMPAKLEAGNLNVPAIAGLITAIDETNQRLSDGIEATGLGISERLHAGLSNIKHVQVLGVPGPIPVVSFLVDEHSPSDVAAILDAEFSIEVRSGFHCAALIHDTLPGSNGCLPAESGTVRVSAGHTTTEHELDRFIDAIKELA